MNLIELAEKWFKKAQSDLITATHMFENVHPKELDISCYHSQQAVEKVLKGFLVYNGENPPYTHDLTVLCQRCAEYENTFSDYDDDFIVLSEYAARTRYPDDFEIEVPETAAAINKAYEIYDFTLDFLPELAEDYRFEIADEDQEIGGMTMK